MNRLTEDMYLTDPNTGEMIELPAGTSITTPDEREHIKKIMSIKNENKKNTEIVAATTKSLCGDFYWNVYAPSGSFMSDITDETLAKIMYLITYIDYETNLLVKYVGSGHKKENMNKKDVFNIMRLSERTFDKFWGNLINNKIITVLDNGSLMVCEQFSKGNLKIKNKKDMVAMKIFTHAVRYVYENIDVRTHKNLSYIFRLIPYINLKYNVLCENPLETDSNKIERMTAKKLCEKLGLDTTHQTRLINSLFKLRFIDINGDSRSVITVITNYKNNERRNFISINPQFYSGYVNETDMTELIRQFGEYKDKIESIQN